LPGTHRTESTIRNCIRGALCAWVLLPLAAFAQSEETEDEAVGSSINYVFATDLGSGIYDLDGRSLQIYRYTYDHELRAAKGRQPAIDLVVPVTAGFFDFNPVDVLEAGPPTRVDSFSVVPGVEFDYTLQNDWHLIPYARFGFSLASSSVDGWLYGTGFRLEKHAEFDGWLGFTRTEFAYAGVLYRDEVPNDRFVRVRQAVELRRAVGKAFRRHRLEIGWYGIFDLILDPPTAPLAVVHRQPMQLETGVMFGASPAIKIWRFDLPRLGFGFRAAGELSGWRIVFGAPF
jgi:hypothetical protein